MKHLFSVVISATMMVSAAQAALIDFAGDAAANGTRASASMTPITIGDLTLQLVALNDTFTEFTDADPYLLAGGLGICSTGLNADGFCADADEAVIGAGEGGGVVFLDGLQDVRSFVLLAEDGGVLSGDTLITVSIIRDTVPPMTTTDTLGAFLALAAANDAFFEGVRGIGFGFADTQFTIASLTVTAVPVPAAGLLFAGAALGGAAWRRRMRAGGSPSVRLHG